MKRLGLFLLPWLLTGCLSRKDALAPMVTIYDPPNGASRSAENLIVRGYAMDDRGIQSIRVDNTELLASDIYQAEKGKQLIQFSFRIRGDSDVFKSTIIASDVSGRETLQQYQLSIDNTPPSVELNPYVNLSGNRIRVSGIARDNDAVKSIVIAGISNSFVPSAEQEFSVDIDVGENMMLEVTDRAGNAISQPITP